MRVVTWLAVAVALWLPPETAAAETFEAGMAAYEAEDYATAYEVWKPLAEAGDPRAQYELGNLYRFAEGVEQDYGKALHWLTKAARQMKDPDMMRRAVYGLGYMVESGHGVQKDLVKAECLYRVSAENGYPNAQYAMCEVLTEKPGFNPALDWCERSARQGLHLGLTRVGQIRLLNPYRDDSEGYMLIFVAARMGDQIAKRIIHDAEAGGEKSVLYSLEKGREMAENWRPRFEEMPEQPVQIPYECQP